jgi:hypothetical protein
MMQSVSTRCRGPSALRGPRPSQHERMRNAGLARFRLGPKEAQKDQPDRKETAEQALKPGADGKALGHKEPRREPVDGEVYHAVSLSMVYCYVTEVIHSYYSYPLSMISCSKTL